MGEVPAGWYEEVVGLLRRVVVVLEQAPWMVGETANERELPETDEPLPTWILTDASVARVEEAIEAEQRVRGQAYGG